MSINPGIQNDIKIRYTNVQQNLVERKPPQRQVEVSRGQVKLSEPQRNEKDQNMVHFRLPMSAFSTVWVSSFRAPREAAEVFVARTRRRNQTYEFLAKSNGAEAAAGRVKWKCLNRKVMRKPKIRFISGFRQSEIPTISTFWTARIPWFRVPREATEMCVPGTLHRNQV